MDVKTVKKQEILMRRLGELLSHNLGYIYGERESGPNGEKKEFLDKGKRFLSQLGNDLGLVQMKVSKNPAGIAVSGEVSLIGLWSEGNGIYVQLSEPAFGGCCVLYRRITHLKECAGFNKFLTTTDLKTFSYVRFTQILSAMDHNVKESHHAAA